MKVGSTAFGATVHIEGSTTAYGGNGGQGSGNEEGKGEEREKAWQPKWTHYL